MSRPPQPSQSLSRARATSAVTFTHAQAVSTSNHRSTPTRCSSLPPAALAPSESCTISGILPSTLWSADRPHAGSYILGLINSAWRGDRSYPRPPKLSLLDLLIYVLYSPPRGQLNDLSRSVYVNPTKKRVIGEGGFFGHIQGLHAIQRQFCRRRSQAPSNRRYR